MLEIENKDNNKVAKTNSDSKTGGKSTQKQV